MITHSLKRRLAYTLLGANGLWYGNRPVPLDRLLWLRKIAGPTKNALAPLLNKTKSTGAFLNNPFLSEVLAGDELGTWSLDAEVLNFLEREIRLQRPQAILEFGCGISTICLTRYMQEVHEQDDILRVYSVEQHSHYAEQTKERLIELRMEHVTGIIHAPVGQQLVEGIETECYQLATAFDTPFYRHPDCIVVDGPAGKEGVRFGTVPLIRRYVAEGTRFFLDDALRDSELQIGMRWSRLSYLTVYGVHLIGKGLLAGCLRNP